MSRVRIVYRRMERDDEYIRRLTSAGILPPVSMGLVWPAGAMLDAYGDSNKIQRRIVEDVQP